MPVDSSRWTANLDHLQINSPDPEALAGWYRDTMGMAPHRLSADLYLVEAPQRRLLIGRGAAGEHPFNAWTLAQAGQLHALREHVGRAGLAVEDTPSPLFKPDAFAVRDPDGRLAVFGLAARDRVPDGVPMPAGSGKVAAMPARLQHAVVATTRLEAMHTFYVERLGFALSDTVYTHEDGEPLGAPHVYFFRSDHEHHSLAAFTGSTSRYDHHCYETTCWNDIRDWLDHLGQLGVAPWWGPGRHGPGNNLFFMIRDLDGNALELSAEIEIMSAADPPRTWSNSRRTYNLWGVSWLRD